MRFRRKRDVEPTASGILVDLRRHEAAGTLTGSMQAQLEGLSEPPLRRARFARNDGETKTEHSLYLLGKLQSYFELTGVEVDREFLVPPMTVYCVAVSEYAARPDVDLRDPRIGIHTYAMIRLERHIGAPLPIERESELLSWLMTQLSLRPVEGSGSVMGRRRARRLARSFPDLPPERPSEGSPAGG